MRRRMAVTGVAIALAVAACGGDDDTAATDTDTEAAADAEPAGGSSGDFCTDLEAIVDAGEALMEPIVNEDIAALETSFAEVQETYPSLAASALESAPDEVRDDVTTVTGWTTGMIEALDTADLSDPASITEVLTGSSQSMPEVTAAGDRLSEHARTECGFDPDAGDAGAAGDAADAGNAENGTGFEMPESPEPPDPCALVDPGVPAAAAGITIDDPSSNFGGDFDLGVMAMKGCAYDRGELVVTTITFAESATSAMESWIDSTESNEGTATTDFDRGSLPENTVITATNGTTTIAVFGAPTPFSLGFSGVDDPATLVAAAEAVLAASS